MYILAYDREQKDKEVFTGYYLQAKRATSTGVPSPTPPDTVVPPVADEGEAETEEGAEDEVNGNNDNNNEGEDQDENSDEMNDYG